MQKSWLAAARKEWKQTTPTEGSSNSTDKWTEPPSAPGYPPATPCQRLAVPGYPLPPTAYHRVAAALCPSTSTVYPPWRVYPRRPRAAVYRLRMVILRTGTRGCRPTGGWAWSWWAGTCATDITRRRGTGFARPARWPIISRCIFYNLFFAPTLFGTSVSDPDWIRFNVQVIFTCLRYTWGGGESAPCGNNAHIG